VARSFYFSGDPFYPVAPALTRALCVDERLGPGLHCSDVLGNAEWQHSNIVGAYGYGHGPVAFAKALALMGTTIGGFSPVNNRFDYPMGPMWYAAWLLVAALALRSRRSRKIALFAGAGALGFFCVWFAGSQQSRWLYPTLLILGAFWGWVTAEARGRTAAVLVLIPAVLALVNMARVARANRLTWDCVGEECLMSKVQYYEDYKRACPPGGVPLSIDAVIERGYLNCVLNFDKGAK
jgi:hypothetical protein